MKVILVDDEQKFITMLAKRLGFRGIKAEAVYTGDEAIQKVRDSKYDVAVLDVKMPGISGLKLKAELSLLDPGLKFIFVTGHGGKQVGDSAQQEIYLSKPLDIDLLIKMMAEVTKQ